MVILSYYNYYYLGVYILYYGLWYNIGVAENITLRLSIFTRVLHNVDAPFINTYNKICK